MKPTSIYAGMIAALVAVAVVHGLGSGPAVAEAYYGFDDTRPLPRGTSFRLEHERAVQAPGEVNTAYQKSKGGWKGGQQNGGGNKGNGQKQVNCAQVTHPNPTVQKKLRLICERQKR